MNNFSLDKRLANDCIILGKLEFSLLLLMNNSLAPWFILVPNTEKIEITDLSQSDQHILLGEINQISCFIKDNFNILKLNTAAIGNIVNQLHIHIVGRDPSDYCWPNVVWGTKINVPYSDDEIIKVSRKLETQLGSIFTPSS